MHFIGMRAQAAADGVEANLHLLVEAHEFLRRELRGGKLEQKINHLAPIEMRIEVVFALGHEERFQFLRRGTGRALGEGGEEFLIGNGDGAGRSECLAQGHRIVVEIVHRLVSRVSQRGEHVVHQVRAIGRQHGERIAWLEGHAAAAEREFKVPRVFGRAVAREHDFAFQAGDAGVPAIEGGRRVGGCGHGKRAVEFQHRQSGKATEK